MTARVLSSLLLLGLLVAPAGARPVHAAEAPPLPESVPPASDPSAPAGPEEALPSAPAPSVARDGGGAKTLALAASFVPGIVLHGSGHWVKGDRPTAERLLVAEGTGLGLVLFGLGGLALTGASRYVVGPLTTVTGFGVGLFGASLLADIYGVLAPADGFGTAPPFAPVALAAGVTGVHDVHYDIGPISLLRAEARYRRFRLAGQGELAPSSGFHRERIVLGYALWRPSRLDTWIEVSGAFMHQNHEPARFAALTGELELSGRIALEPYARSLKGSFVEANTGVALRDVRHANGARSQAPLLLLGMGYGFYIGNSSEVVAYYEHRRDALSGGLLVRGAPAGFAGHIGLRGHWGITPAWGVAADGQVGSAYVGTVALTYRWLP